MFVVESQLMLLPKVRLLAWKLTSPSQLGRGRSINKGASEHVADTNLPQPFVGGHYQVTDGTLCSTSIINMDTITKKVCDLQINQYGDSVDVGVEAYSSYVNLLAMTVFALLL